MDDKCVKVFAALFIDGSESGPRQECKIWFTTTDDAVLMHLDRHLTFPADRGGTATVRFFGNQNDAVHIAEWSEFGIVDDGMSVEIDPRGQTS